MLDLTIHTMSLLDLQARAKREWPPEGHCLACGEPALTRTGPYCRVCPDLYIHSDEYLHSNTGLGFRDWAKKHGPWHIARREEMAMHRVIDQVLWQWRHWDK